MKTFHTRAQNAFCWADKMSLKQDELAQEIVSDFEQLAGDRGNFESQWQEIAERIWPGQTPKFNYNEFWSPGKKNTEFIVDSTAVLALQRFGAILDSLLTPRNQTWHRLRVSNEYLAKDRDVKLYFEQANAAVFKYRYSPKSNFPGQNQQNYMSLGGFGTGCMYADELFGEPGLRYRAIHLGEVYIDENHQGMVDKAYRYFKLTKRQAIRQFGEKELPEQILNSKNPNEKFDFLHCVKPRDEGYDATKLDYRGKLFASYYVAIIGKKIVGRGGYNTFPYAVSRYTQAINEIYGRSPAMDVLPAIKTLNEQKKAFLKQGHRALDPVLLVHDDGMLDGFSLAAGAMNAGGVTADGRPLVHALPTGNLAVGKDQMNEERQLINDSFLVTLFQILVETPQMTATEVMERTREKGILLAPTIGRQQSEYLGSLIDRELDLLSQQRLLPPMPPILLEAKGEYKVEYDSPLTRAQRAEEAAGLMRTVENALAIVNVTQNPEPLDHFDWDVIIPEVASIQAVPERWMRSIADVQAIRQNRANAQQAQMAIQAAPGAAALIKSEAIARKE